MGRPAVGAPLRRCVECGGYEYGGAPNCARCAALVDGILDEEWRVTLGRWEMAAADEAPFAALVVDEPDRHDWRVVDAALDRLTCPDCGGRLSRGPVGCPACDTAHGFRYAAVETDRPGAPWGNEHGIRVNVSVVRRPHVTSAKELFARRLILPYLLVGLTPTTAQAQRIGALTKQSVPDRDARLVEQALDDLFGIGPG